MCAPHDAATVDQTGLARPDDTVSCGFAADQPRPHRETSDDPVILPELRVAGDLTEAMAWAKDVKPAGEQDWRVSGDVATRVGAHLDVIWTARHESLADLEAWLDKWQSNAEYLSMARRRRQRSVRHRQHRVGDLADAFRESPGRQRKPPAEGKGLQRSSNNPSKEATIMAAILSVTTFVHTPESTRTAWRRSRR